MTTELALSAASATWRRAALIFAGLIWAASQAPTYSPFWVDTKKPLTR